MRTNLIIGPPGTGKTTTLVSLIADDVLAGKSPVICSLTRAAAREVKARKIEIHSQNVGTIHSLAYRQLGRPALIEPYIDDWNRDYPNYRLSRSSSDGAQDDFMPSMAQKTEGDKLEALCALMRVQCRPFDMWKKDVQGFYEFWQKFKDQIGVIDFIDMIDLAKDAPPVACDHLYVDEAQDCSRMELDLLKYWARWAGELTLIGDPWQCLYKWRGAHPEMFSAEVSGDRIVLGQSYRVPRFVHRAATAWIKNLSTHEDIEYKPRDFEGFGQTLPATWKNCTPLIPFILGKLDEGKSVMVMGSCSYHIVPLLACLREQGIPFSNPWKTNRGDWNPMGMRRGISSAERLLAFLKPLLEPEEESFDFGARAGNRPQWTLYDLSMWVEAVCAADVLNRGAKTLIIERGGTEEEGGRIITDRDIDEWFFEDVRPFLKELMRGRGTVTGAAGWFSSRLTGSKRKPMQFPIRVVMRGGVHALNQEVKLYIGTIHSFKGAEADCCIVYPDLSMAGNANWMTKGEPRDSVVRLFYVALTRAKEEIYVTNYESDLSCDVGSYLNGSQTAGIECGEGDYELPERAAQQLCDQVSR